MRDFIFVTGPSGVGKTTLSKALLEHYKSTCIEQWMIPEFISYSLVIWSKYKRDERSS